MLVCNFPCLDSAANANAFRIFPLHHSPIHLPPNPHPTNPQCSPRLIPLISTPQTQSNILPNPQTPIPHPPRLKPHTSRRIPLPTRLHRLEIRIHPPGPRDSTSHPPLRLRPRERECSRPQSRPGSRFRRPRRSRSIATVIVRIVIGIGAGETARVSDGGEVYFCLVGRGEGEGAVFGDVDGLGVWHGGVLFVSVAVGMVNWLVLWKGWESYQDSLRVV